MNDARVRAEEALTSFFAAHGVEHEPGVREGEWVAVLPGTARLRTTTSWLVGPQHVSVSAFVCRNPDENHQAVYGYLLRKNLGNSGVAYGIDGHGDIFVTATVPTLGIDEDTVDRLLGAIAVASDGTFNDIVKLGFAESIRKEYAWRVSRGESLANLAAFTEITGHSDDSPQ